jgi:hypothetical protein
MFDRLPSESEILVSLDVGKVTGAAVWIHTMPTDIIATEIPTRYDVRDFVKNIYESDYKLSIACENFVISERTIKTAQDHNALRLIGWLDLWCEEHQVPFTLRTAAAAKSFATNDKLKALDWYVPTKDGHANDAVRHALIEIRASYPEIFNTQLIPSIAKVIL